MTLTIEDGMVQLDRAIELLGANLPEDAQTARQTAEHVRGRIQVGGQNTVVVLAGATGSGKSSLLNALAGQDVALVAPTRPTTGEPLAVSGADATDVLDWMDVRSRRVLPGALGEDRLVVVDLPDVDSVEQGHRKVADSLIERADAVVFVLDPQKYADAVIHKEYLERFMEHGASCVVVLNQVDRLAAQEREGVLADVSALLARDGLEAPILLTSARTGEGMPAVRQALLDFVRERDAARLKVATELRSQAVRLAQAVREDGGREVSGEDEDAGDFAPVAQTIVVAAGVDDVAKAASDSYLIRAGRATSWPPVRWMRRVSDPLVRLGLVDVPTRKKDARRGNLAAGSSTVARSRVREYVDERLGCLPGTWRVEAAEENDERTSALIESADSIMSGVDLEYHHKPRWWSVVNAFQIVFFLLFLAGAAWSLGLAVASVFQADVTASPRLGPLPLSVLLMVGGLVAGWLLGVASKRRREQAAEQVRTRVERRLAEVVKRKATESIFNPIEAERSRYVDFIGSVEKLALVN